MPGSIKAPGILQAIACSALVATAFGLAPRAARADCVQEVGRVRAVANAMMNELSRRFALYHLEVAVGEHYDGDDDECRAEVAEAEHIIRTQPFTMAPGDRLGLPESESPPPRRDEAHADDGAEPQ